MRSTLTAFGSRKVLTTTSMHASHTRAFEKGVAKHMGKSAKAFRMQGLKAAKVERQTKPKPKVQQQDISKAQRQGKGPATVVKSPAALNQKSKA
jgi:hypothetical protein